MYLRKQSNDASWFFKSETKLETSTEASNRISFEIRNRVVSPLVIDEFRNIQIQIRTSVKDQNPPLLFQSALGRIHCQVDLVPFHVNP